MNHLEAENERLQREIESHQVVGQAAAVVMQAYLNEIAALESKVAVAEAALKELQEATVPGRVWKNAAYVRMAKFRRDKAASEENTVHIAASETAGT